MTGSPTEEVLTARRKDLRRITEALDSSVAVFHSLNPGAMRVDFKEGGSPVTDVDRAVNQHLFELLARNGDGWLSEETADDPSRLEKKRVWVVDPLDGTKEFVSSIPEWCVSIGLVEEGRAIAGGICNPATGEVFIGSLETGFTLKGDPKLARDVRREERPLVLASRSETSRGEWDRFHDGPFAVQPVGSVAYKLALVSAGCADATWTLEPKHEWDVAAGVALVLASGGVVKTLQGPPPQFNRPKPRLDGLIAFSADGYRRFGTLLEEWLAAAVPPVRTGRG